MNNKVKSQNKLYILVPVLFIIFLLVADTINSMIQNKKLKNITESIIKEVIEDDQIDYDDYYYQIKRRYEKNKIDTEMLYVETDNYEITVENTNYYFGIFSLFRGYNFITGDVKLFGKNIKMITAIKKVDRKYEYIKILGAKFKVIKGSSAYVNVTVRHYKEGDLEFKYAK